MLFEYASQQCVCVFTFALALKSYARVRLSEDAARAHAYANRKERASPIHLLHKNTRQSRRVLYSTRADEPCDVCCEAAVAAGQYNQDAIHQSQIATRRILCTASHACHKRSTTLRMRKMRAQRTMAMTCATRSATAPRRTAAAINDRVDDIS